jgi:hypothetical protein
LPIPEPAPRCSIRRTRDCAAGTAPRVLSPLVNVRLVIAGLGSAIRHS